MYLTLFRTSILIPRSWPYTLVVISVFAFLLFPAQLLGASAIVKIWNTRHTVGFDPTGVEIVPEVAAIAARDFPVVVDTLAAASFGEGIFDVVRMNNVIEHVPEPVGLME